MSLNRCGVVLAELLVAALLTVVVVALALGSLRTLQRAAQQQIEHAARHLNLLTTAHLIQAELGGLSPKAGDLGRIGPAQLEYRATRATGWACGRVAEGLLLPTEFLRAVRLPVPGRDSVLTLVFAGDSAEWLSQPVVAAPRSGSCPGGGAPALVIPIPGGALDGAAIPGPVLVFETMELRLYRSGTEWWLGLRSVSSGETIQPATGPFEDSGVAFRFLDAEGVEVARSDQVRRIAVLLRGTASLRQGIGAGARALRTGLSDSLAFDVILRGDP